MIDLTSQISQAQIVFFLAVIAIGVTYMAFGKKPSKKKHSKSHN